MDANEVTQEFSKAAKTFIGNSQEYCFLFIDWWPLCMTKSEWSGWMQFIGAMLALIVAISLPFYQQRLKRIRNYLIGEQCIINQNGAIIAILSHDLINKTVKEAISITQAQIKSINDMVKEVKYSELSYDTRLVWSRFNASTIKLMALNNSADGDAQLTVKLQKLDEHVSLLLKEYQSSDPRFYFFKKAL